MSAALPLRSNNPRNRPHSKSSFVPFPAFGGFLSTTMAKPQTVEEYIAQAPEGVREKLEEMRQCLRELTPDATESLKWGIPAFSHERILYTYAGFKRHIGFYPTPDAIVAFEKELAGYKTAKGSIQFPLEKALPVGLIRKIARFRIKELRERDARWR